MSHELRSEDITDEVILRFLDKCRVNDSGCWIWQGFIRKMGKNHYPFINILGHPRSARLIAWWIKTAGTQGFKRVTPSCTTYGCVCPGHMEVWHGNGMGTPETAAHARTFVNKAS